MNKQKFLSMLRERLTGLPEEDIERSVDFYREIIDDRMDEGLSEEDAIQAVGSIDEIVSQILKETSLPKLVKAKVKPNRALRVWEIILLVLGAPLWLPLVATVICLILTVYILLWTAITCLYSVVFSFAATAITGIFGAFVLSAGSHLQGIFMFGIGLLCAGITVLLFFIFNQITKGVLILSKQILLGIKGWFIRKGDA